MLLQTVRKINDDIDMKFGLEKRAKVTFLQGRLVAKRSLEISCG